MDEAASPETSDTRRIYVREWREHAKLSKAELARRIKRNRSAVTEIESGAKQLTEYYIFKIADAVGCNPCDLFEPPPASGRKRAWLDDVEHKIIVSLRLVGPDERHRIAAVCETLVATSPQRAPAAGFTPAGESPRAWVHEDDDADYLPDAAE